MSTTGVAGLTLERKHVRQEQLIMAPHPAAFEKGRSITANGLDIYVEQVGHGPEVLLIGGHGDTVES